MCRRDCNRPSMPCSPFPHQWTASTRHTAHACSCMLLLVPPVRLAKPIARNLQADGQRYVLRKKPPGKLLASAHAIEREYRVLSALHHTQVHPVWSCGEARHWSDWH